MSRAAAIVVLLTAAAYAALAIALPAEPVTVEQALEQLRDSPRGTAHHNKLAAKVCTLARGPGAVAWFTVAGDLVCRLPAPSRKGGST